MARFGAGITLPGALLVNDLPFRKCSPGLCIGYLRLRSISLVRYIPGWLSWLSYKPLASYGYDLGQEAMNKPMEFVRESMVRKYFYKLEYSLRLTVR
jgi:hypothetical protein